MIQAATQSHPNETGGMLLGWLNPARNEAVVTTALGAGPSAEYEPTSFHPDSDWQQSRLEEIYERTAGVVTFLGDWHVHPSGGFGLSRQDRRTMKHTATTVEARCSHPLMGLLARTDQRYLLGVWRWRPGRWHHPFGEVSQLPVRTWRPQPEEETWS